MGDLKEIEARGRRLQELRDAVERTRAAAIDKANQAAIAARAADIAAREAEEAALAHSTALRAFLNAEAEHYRSNAQAVLSLIGIRKEEP